MYKKEEANHFEPLEFGKTTVYKRKEPTYYVGDEEVSEGAFVDAVDGKRVTYMEKQLTYREYYAELEEENKQLRTQIDVLVSSLDFTNDVVDELIVSTLGGGA